MIAAGLCSDADDALVAAVNDTRITGLLLLDRSGFRTPRFRVNRLLHHYRHRLFNKNKWVNLPEIIRSKFNAKTNLSKRTIESEDRPLMDPENFLPTVKALAERSVKMHFIYTGGIYEYYNYSSQVYDMFSQIKLRHVVTEAFYNECDHLFMLRRHRQAVLENMLAWVQISFGSQVFSQTNINFKSQSIGENKLLDGDSESSSQAA